MSVNLFKHVMFINSGVLTSFSLTDGKWALFAPDEEGSSNGRQYAKILIIGGPLCLQANILGPGPLLCIGIYNCYHSTGSLSITDTTQYTIYL